jgi:hypothetical protein
MLKPRIERASLLVPCLFIVNATLLTDSVHAGHKNRRARAVEVVVQRPAYPVPNSQRTLGTFQPTPYIVVRGNNPVGAGGYSPLGMYGDSAMVEYGPFSPLRAGSAPVQTYTRSYDGQVHVTDATTTSYPNMPVLAPVVYPTQANNYYGPRTQLLPSGANAINWRDQN